MPVIICQLLANFNVSLGKDDDVLLQLAIMRTARGLIARVAVGVAGVVQQMGHIPCNHNGHVQFGTI